MAANGVAVSSFRGLHSLADTAEDDAAGPVDLSTVKQAGILDLVKEQRHRHNIPSMASPHRLGGDADEVSPARVWGWPNTVARCMLH